LQQRVTGLANAISGLHICYHIQWAYISRYKSPFDFISPLVVLKIEVLQAMAQTLHRD